MSVGRYRAGKDVFLSYDREDTVKKFVRKLKTDLESAQLSVWLDEEDIPAGTEWPRVIGIALSECKALIAVLTKKYVSSPFCKSELYVACTNQKPIFPVIREKGWDSVSVDKECEGVKYMIAASNWVSFLPTDDYGSAIQRLIAGLKARLGRPLPRQIDDLKKQDSLTGQPPTPDIEPPHQSWAQPTPRTEHLGGRKPTPEMIPPASQKPKRVPQQCRQFVRLIGKLSNILSKDPASDALVLGRLKLAIATLKEQDETISIEPEVYRGAQTVTDFFMVMAKYWNCYDDYDLLEMVIESTENEEAMKILNDFLQNRDRGVIVPTEKCPEAPFQNIRDRGVDEERHLAALKLAIRRKGSLDKTIMQCVFVGPPRSGKSTLMKRMVGERPSSSSSFSTGVANKVVQVIVRSSSAAASVSGSKWVKLSHDDEAVMIVMDTSHLNEVAGSERHSQATETVPQPERCNTTLDTSVSKQNKHQAKLSESSAASSDVADPKLAVDFCKGALQRNLQYAKKILQDKGWLIYLTDTGGQIEFQELLPLLVSGPSVFFLVFRLDQDLNERFTVEYVRPNGETSKPYQSTFTVQEALLQSLVSIAFMTPYINRGDKQVTPITKVFFVGTHKDKVTPARVDHINGVLCQLVKSTGLYRKGVIQFASESRILLVVNNLSEDDSDIQLVQAAVERLGRQGDFKVTAPPSWLIFSLIIRENKDRVLSYKQCFEVARQCGITSREELNEALWFLHTKVGLIRHFQGEGLKDLQEIVIQDPQVLFDRITDLVVETFTFDKANPVDQEDFKKRGIFSYSTFESISGTSDHLLTPSRLVKLLEHLHIIAPFEEEGEKKYFMPCVLAHAQTVKSSSRLEGVLVWLRPTWGWLRAMFWQGSEQSPTNSSLLVGFRGGYCPKGLFAALVVYLLAKRKSHFQWRLQTYRIFKDQVSFSVGPYDTVSITVQPKFFAIACTPASSALSPNRHPPLAVTCGEVRHCIETGICEVTSALHYTNDAAHYLAFYCPEKHQGPDLREPHPAEIYFHAGKPCTIWCELAERPFQLLPEHERWFTEVHSGVQVITVQPRTHFQRETGSGNTHPKIGDRPRMSQLQNFVGVKVVQKLAADWEKLALALNFDHEIIREVERSQHFQVEGACRTILQRWLDGQGSQPATWDTLVKCLEDIDHRTLATDLRKELAV